MSVIDYALSAIVSYDGHADWLMNLADELDACKGFYSNPLPTELWATNRHFIWMLLVGMFGSWGTSIRSGWIENTADAARFIRSICKDDLDDLVNIPGVGWRYREEDEHE